LVFHCEFSSERGPTLYRFLRTWDRQVHEDTYPELYYPELYILDGGYKIFFQSYPELCEPQGYVQMLDRRFAEEMKCGMRTARQNKVRGVASRSRSWAVDSPLPSLFSSTTPLEADLRACERLTNSSDDLSILSISPKRGWGRGTLKRSASAIIFPNFVEQTESYQANGASLSAEVPRCQRNSPLRRSESMAVDNQFAFYSSSSDEEEGEEEEEEEEEGDEDDTSFLQL